VTFPGPSGTVLVGDGGMASTLETRGHDLSDALWCRVPRVRDHRFVTC